MESHLYHTHHYPTCPSYPTVLCGIGGTVLWTPMCTTHTTILYIYIYVYMSILYGIGRTVLWIPSSACAFDSLMKHDVLKDCQHFHYRCESIALNCFTLYAKTICMLRSLLSLVYTRVKYNGHFLGSLVYC